MELYPTLCLQARVLANMGEFAEALELAAAIPASQVNLVCLCCCFHPLLDAILFMMSVSWQ